MPHSSRVQRHHSGSLQEVSGEEIRARQPNANQDELEEEERKTWGTKVKGVKGVPLSMTSDTTRVSAAHKQRDTDWAQGTVHKHDRRAPEVSRE